MAEIIPAIIPKTFDDLEEHLSLVSRYTNWVQIDVLDGRLTSAKSWPYLSPVDDDFARIIREEEGFPFWEDLQFEIDLMIKEPEAVLHQWVAAGASRLVVHFESFESAEKAKEAVDDFKNKFSLPGSILSVQIGLAANLNTPLEEFSEIIPLFDFFQCMGIAEIGAQGNPFDERALERIEEIKEMHPDLPIAVDGGVNLDTAERLISAGATRLVAGSAIFESDNIPGTINELKGF